MGDRNTHRTNESDEQKKLREKCVTATVVPPNLPLVNNGKHWQRISKLNRR
jgi:hypothetical protein